MNLSVTDSQKNISLAVIITLTGVLLLGLGLRLIDLNDPPLDFNPTRQLRSAIIARGLYYERALDADPVLRTLAVSHMNTMERLEPPIFETLVAWVYGLLGGENLALARMFASLFWIIGALVLFDLGRRMTSPWAALAGVSVFLFLPFSVRASRSFQPDPGMVTLIILTAWSLYLWQEKRTWNWALVAGLFGCLTVLVKIVGLFFVAGITLSMLGYILGIAGDSLEFENAHWRLSNLEVGLRNSQVWFMAALMIFPSLIYYLLGLGDPDSSSFLHWTVIARWQDILTPSFYMRWLVFLDDLVRLVLIFFALLGTLVTTPRNRALLWGFGGGYLLFCLFFPYHTLTHDYYHLPLVALLSLSLTPLVDLVINAVVWQSRGVRVALGFVLLLFIAYNGWIGRSILVGQDFREHPVFWQEVGEAIPVDAKAIGLSQDFGFRLMYYGWRKITLWPNNAHPEDLPEMAAGADYFVVTAKNQMGEQLENYLDTHYAIFVQGPGYIIYDLQSEY
jgi:hypothetical protein